MNSTLIIKYFQAVLNLLALKILNKLLMKNLLIISFIAISLFSCKKKEEEELLKKNVLKFEKAFGSPGTGLAEFKLQGGNLWNGTYAMSDNHFYIKDVHNHRVQRFTHQLQPLDWFGYDNAWGFHTSSKAGADSISPHSIYFKNNFLYITRNFFDKRVIKVDPQTGSVLKTFLFHSYIEGLVVDNAGNLYMGEGDNMIITKYNSDGDSLFSIGGYGAGEGKMNFWVASMTVDNQNNLYVCDQKNNRIQKFSPDGSLLKIWTVETKSGAEIIEFYDNNIYVGEGKNLVIYDTDGKRISSYEIMEGYASIGRFKMLSKDKLIMEQSYENNFHLMKLTEE
jgi:hypothetical protein